MATDDSPASGAVVIPDAVEETYRTVDDVVLRIWRFSAAGAVPAPAICFFFGGGWAGGTPAQFTEQARYLASRGVTAFLADYRVSSRHGSRLPDSIADARAAIDWIAENAERLGVDAGRIAASGGSAGGYLAGATALLPTDEPHRRPAALVLFNPVVEFQSLGDGVVEALRTEEGGPLRELALEGFSLMPGAVGDLPPTLILHGRADEATPFESVARFAADARSAGNHCELVGYDEQPHGFFNHHSFIGSHDRMWAFVATLRRLDEFLARLGWISGPPTVV